MNSVFTIAISGVSRNGTVPGYAERCSAVMAAAYSQDNVGGDDAIVSYTSFFRSTLLLLLGFYGRGIYLCISVERDNFIFYFIFISPHTRKIQEMKEVRQIQYTSMQDETK